MEVFLTTCAAKSCFLDGMVLEHTQAATSKKKTRLVFEAWFYVSLILKDKTSAID